MARTKNKRKQQLKGNVKREEKSRKLLRKEKRLEKKNKRANYIAKKVEWNKVKKELPNISKQRDQALLKNIKTDKGDKGMDKSPQVDKTQENLKKELKEKEKLESEMAKQRKKQLLEANKEEDREIKRLEKLLKLNKRKKKTIPKSFYEDNLGSLLEVCDKDYLKQLAQTEKAIQDSGSEFEEDFAAITGKKVDQKKKKKEKLEEKSPLYKCADDSDSSNSDFTDSQFDSGDDESPDELEISKAKIKESKKKRSAKVETSSISKPDNNCEEDSTASDFDGSDNFSLGVDDQSDSESDLDREDDVILNDTDENSEEDDIDVETDKERQNVKVTKSKSNDKGQKRVRFDDDLNISQKSKKLKQDSINGHGLKGTQLLKEKHNQVKEKIKKSTEGKNNNKKVQLKSKNCENSINSEDDQNSDDEDIGSDDDLSGENDLEDDELEHKPKGAFKKNADGTWEDIYGRLRSGDGDVIQERPGKYVPPALRGETSDSKRRELERLRRQMKGLMNRLAENNMASISSQLDEMYMTNSRHDMNNSLTQLTLEALVSRVLTPDRLVMEHCLLISLLHANVGSEVGAHYLQEVVKRFSNLLEEEIEVEDKRVDNLLHIISHLYNFKIFSASLIFSIVDKVAETLNEKRIDLLLLILRTVGSTLRKDDPNALKSFVLRLQAKASATPELQKSSRVKFMLEVLLAIKNNNMMKIPNYNPENIEHAKKLLRSLIRRGKYITELNISLEDLLKADERGRWWIVGSAWTGHLPGESNMQSTVGSKEIDRKLNSSYNVELLELAKKQRMNTDTRRNIFCVLLSAEDYLDAFEKLLHLNLKNQQEQEIIHVLLHCALQEKTFNPYYAHLAQKFCDFDRKYQMKIQYCIWDKLKDLGSLKSFQISNFARLLAHLFLEKGLPISVLKVVSFAEIDKISVRLIRQVLLSVLLVEDKSESEAVFLRVAPSPKLRLFREGLRLFIRHFMLRPSSTKFLSERELSLLTDRAAVAEKALSAAETELHF